jgi:hypothetical protein
MDGRTSGTGGWYQGWTYLGYRRMVLRMDAPSVHVAGTREGRTLVKGGWFQGWTHLGYRRLVLGMGVPRLHTVNFDLETLKYVLLF